MGRSSQSWVLQEKKNIYKVSLSDEKKLSNETQNAVRYLYGVSSFDEKSKDQKLDSCLTSLETANLKVLKCKSRGERFHTLRSLEAEKVDHKKAGFHNGENKKLGLNNNDGIASTLPVPYSASSPDLSNHRSSHSSSSSLSLSSRESPNSVLGSTVNRTSVSQSENLNSRVNSGNKNLHKGNERDNDRNCFRNGNILSFGNIYRNSKNMVAGDEKSFTDDSVPSSKSDRGTPKHSEVARSNNHILGFGGGNYGHGSVIKGVKNIKKLPGTNYLTLCDSSTKKEGKLTRPITGTSPSCLSVEELNNAGNEEYKKGRFSEAISLYNKVIALCPRNAPSHSNKAAALAGLRRFSESVDMYLEAIKCDPSHSRAHYKLGTLYTRLGQVEDAKQHLNLSGQQLNSEAFQNLLKIESHLTNMRMSHGIGDWNCVLEECNSAIDAGADASDEVLAFKAEALLKLHRAKEALEVLMAAKRSEINRSRKIHQGNVHLLIIEIQVNMYLGRFEDGVIAAECAVRLDCGPEPFVWLRKARAAADAHKTGNELFKAGKHQEACIAYGRGLEYAPMNNVLLCNRAACRTKLGQWEMAVEDCNAALRNRPDYTKALLRRAHSNAKLGLWEESLRDYEVLRQEMPGDLSIAHSLYEVQLELKKAQGEKAYTFQLAGQVIHLCSYAQFMRTIKLAGLALLQFFKKSDERCKQLSPFVNELLQRYPSWNFLKVDVEENPDWALTEQINFVPIFVIYKNGLKLREIFCPDAQILEQALNLHSL